MARKPGALHPCASSSLHSPGILPLQNVPLMAAQINDYISETHDTFLRHHDISQITDLRWSGYGQCTVMYYVHLSKQWYLQLCCQDKGV